MLSIKHFLCQPKHRPPSKVPWRMVLERLSWPTPGFKWENDWYFWVLSREDIYFCICNTSLPEMFTRAPMQRRLEEDLCWMVSQVLMTLLVKGHTWTTLYFDLFTYFLLLLQLYCPNGIPPIGKSELLFQGKASCDRVALPNLLCMLGILVLP